MLETSKSALVESKGSVPRYCRNLPLDTFLSHLHLLFIPRNLKNNWRPLGEKCRKQVIRLLGNKYRERLSPRLRCLQEQCKARKIYDISEKSEEIRRRQIGRRNRWRSKDIILTRKMKAVITFKLYRKYLLVTGITEIIKKDLPCQKCYQLRPFRDLL